MKSICNMYLASILLPLSFMEVVKRITHLSDICYANTNNKLFYNNGLRTMMYFRLSIGYTCVSAGYAELYFFPFRGRKFFARGSSCSCPPVTSFPGPLPWLIELYPEIFTYKKGYTAYLLTLTNIRFLLSPMRYFPSATRKTGNLTGHVHWSRT